jgi:hypothetical protein
MGRVFDKKTESETNKLNILMIIENKYYIYYLIIYDNFS